MNNKAIKQVKNKKLRNQKRRQHKKIKKLKRIALEQKLSEQKQFQKQKLFVDLDILEQSKDHLPQQQIIPEQEIRYLQISHHNYLFICQLGKFYKVKASHEQNLLITINTIDEFQLLSINGKTTKQYTNHQSFIFHIQKPEKATIKLDHILAQNQEFKHQQILNFVSKINLKYETIIQANYSIIFQQCNEPWKGLPSCVSDNEPLMIIGSKNTGKSTLGQFILNKKAEDCVMLDCDVGKNSSLEGCISLVSQNYNKKIWIGQFTPLNNLQTYLRAIHFLFSYYREYFFTKKLVVNTMGYISGLGQFLLYEIYQIVRPKSVLILSSPQTQKYSNIKNIVQNFRTGNYIKKLYVSKSQNSAQPSTSQIFYFENQHCHSKKGFSRFQKMFECNSQKISDISQLLELIRQSNFTFSKRQILKCYSRNKLSIYQQSRHGKIDVEGLETVEYKKVASDQNVDMRIIVLGRMINDVDLSKSYLKGLEDVQNKLFQVSGLGFCYDSRIYSKELCQDMIGVVCEGMDFEKGFYHLNERQMIELEFKMGRIPFIMAVSGGLGSKGMRNNPSKTI